MSVHWLLHDILSTFCHTFFFKSVVRPINTSISHVFVNDKGEWLTEDKINDENKWIRFNIKSLLSELCTKDVSGCRIAARRKLVNGSLSVILARWGYCWTWTHSIYYVSQAVMATHTLNKTRESSAMQWLSKKSSPTCRWPSQNW